MKKYILLILIICFFSGDRLSFYDVEVTLEGTPSFYKKCGMLSSGEHYSFVMEDEHFILVEHAIYKTGPISFLSGYRKTVYRLVKKQLTEEQLERFRYLVNVNERP